MNDEKHFGLRIEDVLLRKFRYVCAYEGRSANSQMLILIRDYISKFEKNHGNIKVSSTKHL